MEKNFWLVQPTRFGPVNAVRLVSRFLLLYSWSFLFLSIPTSKWTKPIEIVVQVHGWRRISWRTRSKRWKKHQLKPTVCSRFSTLRSIPPPLQSLFFFNSFAYVDEMNPYETLWDWNFFLLLTVHRD